MKRCFTNSLDDWITDFKSWTSLYITLLYDKIKREFFEIVAVSVIIPCGNLKK